MRDLFRLIAVGLVSFAIVGLAMVYTRGGDVRTAFKAVSDSVTGAVGDLAAPVTGTTTPEPAATHSLSIARPRAASWVGLAGFPDQSEIVFPVPKDGNYLSGALNLVFDTQLAEDGDGLLTLSVNNTPRGQLVLNAGRHTHQARIELTAADLGSDRIVLQMAGRGTTNSGQICPTDAANSGSAVTLTAESRLELVSLDAPADTVGVLLASPGTLALKPGPNAGDTALAIWANQQLLRAGIDARLSEGGPGETPVTVTSYAVTTTADDAANMVAGETAIASLVSAAGTRTLPLGNGPVTVAELGAETLVKSFRGSRRWTIPFAAADMPGGRLPETFALRLKTTPLTGENDWMVRVTLNGNLIEAYRVAGSSDTLSFEVALPAERLLPANSIVVELVDTTPNEGICKRQPDAQAQLLPESQLIDTAPAPAGWAALIEELAASPSLALKAEGLSLAQARNASELLSLVLPRNATMRFAGDAPMVLSAVARDAVTTALVLAGDGTRVLVPVPGSAGKALELLAPGPDLNNALSRLVADDVAIIISTP